MGFTTVLVLHHRLTFLVSSAVVMVSSITMSKLGVIIAGLPVASSIQAHSMGGRVLTQALTRFSAGDAQRLPDGDQSTMYMPPQPSYSTKAAFLPSTYKVQEKASPSLPRQDL